MLDLTVGAGGHSFELARQAAPRGELIGVDRDPAILLIAEERLRPLPDVSVRLLHGDFGDLNDLRERVGDLRCNVILADLGVSSLQLDDPDRGFAFRFDGPLDMRMDRSRGRSAAELLRDAPVDELVRIIRDFGEERRARQVARAIDDARATREIRTTGELAKLVRSVVPASRDGIDPATRTFQGLRIEVNGELESLEHLLDRFGAWLLPGGRFGVISFHSLEDRRVKQAFRRRVGEGDYELVTRKAVRPTVAEAGKNPRSRSSRLRVIRKRT